MIKAGIVGATGYAGAEILKILARHPQAQIVWIDSRQNAGERISDIYPNLRGICDLVLEDEDSGEQGIPLVGTVAAGIPITAIENITDHVEFIPSKHYDGKLFALKIRGESMINIGIFDGDIVVVEQTDYAENGDVVVALVDRCEATVKTFYKEDGHYRLQPENDTMDPIIVDEVEILGRVVSLIRYF